MLYLGEVLQRFQAQLPLGVSAPVLLTRTGFGPKDLVQCLLYSLGSASARMRVEGDKAEERVIVAIGRGDGCEIVLPDTSVSKKHCALERRDGYWWVEDLGSTNGTMVDGFRVPRNGRLRVRGRFATIEVGPDSKLTFMDEAELNVFLPNALDAWRQAFGKGGTRFAEPPKPAPAAAAREPEDASVVMFTDQIVESPLLAKAPEAPTQKLRRDQVAKRIEDALAKAAGKKSQGDKPQGDTTPGFMPPVPEAAPADLEDRLRIFAKAQATFRIILIGSRVEEPDTLEEALAIVRSGGKDLVSVEVLDKRGGKSVLFRRPSADDSQELPALRPDD
jgi:pSer/pThr/pTyr-binding forkhead associated (FHA) protein